MGSQTAGFNPCHFALWYEHFAGLNSNLSRLLNAQLAEGTPLTDAQVSRLYAEHVLARELASHAALREELQKVLQGTAHDTAEAERSTCAFDRALEGHVTGLAQNASLEQLEHTISSLRVETLRMRADTARLTAKLRESSAQVEILTENLLRAQNEALHDPLTGLKNRRAFEEAALLWQQENGSLAGASVLVIDVDHFKQINDTHGHLLGDKVLQAVAKRLQKSIKGQDTAARFGGEEFVILLPATNLNGAALLARQLRLSVAQGRIVRLDGAKSIGAVTISIGVAEGRVDDNLQSLIERADRAMYQAKLKGRDRVELAAAS